MQKTHPMTPVIIIAHIFLLPSPMYLFSLRLARPLPLLYNLLTVVGKFTAESIRQFVIDFGCELAKRSLLP